MDTKEMGDKTITVGDTVRMQYPEKYNFGWISVKDRLPNDKEEYLVLNKYKIVFVAAFLPSLGDFCASSITHWMPLPEPPK